MINDKRGIAASLVPVLGLAFLLMALPAASALGQPAPVHPGETGGAIGSLMARARGTAGLADGLEDLRARAGEAGVPEDQLAGLMERVVTLAEDGLPWNPVLDRARQGFAKKAAFLRIDDVCRGLDDRLREGARVVDVSLPVSTPGSLAPGDHHRLDLIDHAAFALEKGVPAASLQSLFTRLAGAADEADRMGAMASPVVALTSLTAEGVPPDRGVSFVGEAFMNGLRGRTLENLGLAVAELIHDGGPRDEILGRVTDQIRRRAAPDQILSDIRAARDHGDRPGAGPPDERRPGDRSGGPGSDTRPPDDPGQRGRGHGSTGGPGGGTRGPH